MDLNEKIMQRLLQTFKIEAREHNQLISNKLIVYENEEDKEKKSALIEEIYRAAHSLKGAARAVGLNQIVNLCQNIENVFSGLKKNELNESRELFDSTLNGVQIVSKFVEEEDPGKRQHMENEIEVLSTEIASLLLKYKKEENSEKTFQKEKNKPVAPPQKIRTSGKTKKTSSAAEEITENKDKTIPQETKEKPKPVPEKDIETDKSKEIKIADSIRVSVKKLESIYYQAEELQLVKQAVEKHASDLSALRIILEKWNKKWNKAEISFNKLFDFISEYDLEDSLVYPLKELLKFVEYNEMMVKDIDEVLNKITDETDTIADEFEINLFQLNDIIKKSLLLPTSVLTDQFPIMVRDIATELGKDILFNISGETIELDKRVLEELKDPLVHLIRNSIDHGIESPEERVESGKNRKGRISLKFRISSGNKVEILVIDDGKGIDIDKIKESVIKKGIVSEKELSSMEESEILNLIFLSDVSTSKVITDLSGRGLGMAIAREKVRKLGGDIRVSTEKGMGTTFILEVPVTVSSVRGILIKTGPHKFYIKTDEVIAAIRIDKKDLVMVENKMTFKYLDRHIAVTELSALLGLNSRNSAGKYTIVIIKHGQRELGLIVDELLGDEEIVIKPFSKQIKNLKFYEGIAVSLMGSLIPVLKIKDIFIAASGVGKSFIHSEESQIGSKNILVVDDSITSRLLIKDILEHHGYLVKTAVNGKEAWTKLRNEKFDLIVSDIEMPKMNGFELTKKIRSSEKYSDVPVVLVTGLAKQEDMEKGIDSGADAYIVKSDFKQSNLLETVQRLL